MLFLLLQIKAVYVLSQMSLFMQGLQGLVVRVVFKSGIYTKKGHFPQRKTLKRQLDVLTANFSICQSVNVSTHLSISASFHLFMQSLIHLAISLNILPSINPFFYIFAYILQKFLLKIEKAPDIRLSLLQRHDSLICLNLIRVNFIHVYQSCP